ncbi:MAG: DUF2341 domain-containing protein, partial [Candidatus Heimdallarchaeaceae archaeon]
MSKFGYDGSATDYISPCNVIRGGVFNFSGGSYQKADKISVYGRFYAYNTTFGMNVSVNVKCAIYRKLDNSLVAETEERSLCQLSFAWTDFEFSEPPNLINGEDYILVVWSSLPSDSTDYSRIGYASNGTGRYQEKTYDSFPDPLSASSDTNKYCIYCEYSPIDWLSGWTYRKRHTINSASGAGTGYQVRIKAHYNSSEWANSEKSGFKGLTINTERALYEDGEIILPYQASDGNIRVKVYDAKTFQELHDYLVGTDALSDDYHGTPAIIKFGNYYVLCYGEHDAYGTLKIAYSTDLENWTIYDFPLSGDFTYPQLFVWKDGNLYLLIRYASPTSHDIWRLYKCTDVTNSSSWSLVNTIVDEGSDYRPYVISRVVYDETRLILTWGRYNFNTEQYENYLMCAYTDDLSTWYDADGNSVSLPLNYSKCHLTTLSDKVAYARAENYGNKIWILVRWRDLANNLLIEKTIGGSLSTYDFGIEGKGGELFYHPNEGFLRLYVNFKDSGEWKVRRYKFKNGTLTVEQTYSTTGTRIDAIRLIYPLVDSVIVPFHQNSGNSNDNTILICRPVDWDEDVYLNSHCRTDFGDVRFTKSDGTTLIDYWMEKKVDSDYAIFWVEIPYDLTNTNASIYIYYGKSDATYTNPQQHGEDTFLFFDDFENQTKFNEGTLSISYSQTNVKHGSYSLKAEGGENYKRKTIDQNSSRNRAFETWIMPLSSSVTSLAGIMIAAQTTEKNGYQALLDQRNGTDSSSPEQLRKDYSTENILETGNYNITTNTWYFLRTIWLNNGTIKMELYNENETLLKSISASDSTYTDGHYGICAYQNAIFDVYRVRKYVSPEPSHDIWGSEEIGGIFTILEFLNDTKKSIKEILSLAYKISTLLHRKIILIGNLLKYLSIEIHFSYFLKLLLNKLFSFSYISRSLKTQILTILQKVKEQISLTNIFSNNIKKFLSKSFSIIFIIKAFRVIIFSSIYSLFQRIYSLLISTNNIKEFLSNIFSLSYILKSSRYKIITLRFFIKKLVYRIFNILYLVKEFLLKMIVLISILRELKRTFLMVYFKISRYAHKIFRLIFSLTGKVFKTIVFENNLLLFLHIYLVSLNSVFQRIFKNITFLFNNLAFRFKDIYIANDIQAFISSILDFFYKLRILSSKILSINWKIRALVGNSISLLSSISGLVHKELLNIYKLFSLRTKELFLVSNIKNLVRRNLSIVNNILYRIYSSLTTYSDIKNLIISSIETISSIKKLVSKIIISIYSNIGRIFKILNINYTSGLFIEVLMNMSYFLVTRVKKIFSLINNVLSYISKSISSIFKIRELRERLLVFFNSIINLVRKTILVSYISKNIIYSLTILSYALDKFLTRIFVLLYNLSTTQFISKIHSTSYNLSGLLERLFLINYRIREFVFAILRIINSIKIFIRKKILSKYLTKQYVIIFKVLKYNIQKFINRVFKILYNNLKYLPSIFKIVYLIPKAVVLIFSIVNNIIKRISIICSTLYSVGFLKIYNILSLKFGVIRKLIILTLKLKQILPRFKLSTLQKTLKVKLDTLKYRIKEIL